MKVKILATGESAAYGDAYAARLIEQRRAVPDTARTEKAEKTEKKAEAKTEKAEKPVKKAE